MAGYIGNIPVPQGTQTRQNFTATASQTSFPTIGYTAGFIDVYLNGVKLINGTDFTATNGSDVVLAVGASASDVLNVVIFDTFTALNQTFTDSISVEGDGTSDTAVVTLENTTKENTDGGRESRVRFRGFQSGSVSPHTLAEIQGSHDSTGADQKGDLIFKTNDGSDNAAPTEAARISSDRDFLVGQASQDTSQTGFSARANSLSHFCRDTSTTGAGVLLLNKKTGDGNVLVVQKDSSTVGTIGVGSGDLIVGNGSVGVRFNDSISTLVPRTTADGASDGAIDIGAGSARFKDLFLSGGAYLGGTGAANYLEDYEEGTWTPNINAGYTSATFNIQHGNYTKIGNTVRAYFRLDLSGGTAVGTAVKIGGLPFQPKADADEYSTGFGYINDSASLSDNFFGIVLQASTNVGIYTRSSTTVTGVNGTTLGNSLGILYTVIYRV